ncbi:MAG: hypothetical protein AAF270_10370 [Pseudomonadota bacterium]
MLTSANSDRGNGQALQTLEKPPARQVVLAAVFTVFKLTAGRASAAGVGY